MFESTGHTIPELDTFKAEGNSSEVIEALKGRMAELGLDLNRYHFEDFTDEIHVYDTTVQGWDTFEADDQGNLPGLWMTLHYE